MPCKFCPDGSATFVPGPILRRIKGDAYLAAALDHTRLMHPEVFGIDVVAQQVEAFKAYQEGRLWQNRN